MHKLTIFAIVALTAAFFASPASATVINLDSHKNAGTKSDFTANSSRAVSKSFGPGTYEVTFTQDEYTAFSRWKQNSNDCNDDGQKCKKGWENSAVIALNPNGTDYYVLGDGGGVGPVSGAPSLYFENAADSLTHAAIYSQRFTLSTNQTVYFFIHDDALSDNRGGISLMVRAVPAPSGWLLSLVGFGMIGLLLARRRKTGAPTAA